MVPSGDPGTLPPWEKFKIGLAAILAVLALTAVIAWMVAPI